jgi:hypothetical protein
MPWEKIKYTKDKKENKGKASYLEKGKASKSTRYIVSHYNIGVIEYLFNTSFCSWRDAWLLDIGEAFHMTF